MNDVTLIGNLTADPIYPVSGQNQRGVIRFDGPINRTHFSGTKAGATEPLDHRCRMRDDDQHGLRQEK